MELDLALAALGPALLALVDQRRLAGCCAAEVVLLVLGEAAAEEVVEVLLPRQRRRGKNVSTSSGARLDRLEGRSH